MQTAVPPPPPMPIAPALAGLRRVAVVGCGLIGGSVALACARHLPRVRVSATDRDPAQPALLSRRMQLAAAPDLRACVVDADLVVLAVPPSALPATAAQVLAAAPPHCIVTDVGSVKQPLADWAATLSPAERARVVPAHPIAGGTAHGCAQAADTLFEGRPVVVCPLPGGSDAAHAAVQAFWRTLGASVHAMDAAAHDRLYGALSHLPHLLAFAVVDAVAARHPAGTVAALAGRGFRDFVRIGQAQPPLWADICVSNRDALLDALDQFQLALDTLRAPLEQGDAAALRTALQHTAGHYRAMFDSTTTTIHKETACEPEPSSRQP